MSQPYVSRPEAEAFLAALAAAIETPPSSSALFYLWGIGGVGKSTLLRQVIKTFPQTKIPLVNGLPISFGQTEGIASPADLMYKLHGLLEPEFLSPGQTESAGPLRALPYKRAVAAPNHSRRRSRRKPPSASRRSCSRRINQ